MSCNNINLTAEDYFRYNSPFRQWLFDCKGSQLGDYKTDECRKIFTIEFVPAWNSRKLPKDFYLKGPNFKTDFSKKRETNYLTEFGFSKGEESRLFSHSLPKSLKPRHEQEIIVKRVDKSYLKRKSEDLDELIPKKEGHAKIIEDRRIKSGYTRNERNNPHDLELSDSQLFSGSTSSKTTSADDYETLLRLEKERKAKKERELLERKQEKDQVMREKINKYNQRESEVNEMLKKMICKK